MLSVLFSTVYHSLCTHNWWYVCSHIVWWRGRSTAGSLISSLSCAPDRNRSSAPPAGHHATRPWCSDAEHRGSKVKYQESLKCSLSLDILLSLHHSHWSGTVVFISSHLDTDGHWPWHTGICMTVVQLSTVTFMFVTFGAQLWLPGVRRQSFWMP